MRVLPVATVAVLSNLTFSAAKINDNINKGSHYYYTYNNNLVNTVNTNSISKTKLKSNINNKTPPESGIPTTNTITPTGSTPSDIVNPLSDHGSKSFSTHSQISTVIDLLSQWKSDWHNDYLSEEKDHTILIQQHSDDIKAKEKQGKEATIRIDNLDVEIARHAGIIGELKGEIEGLGQEISGKKKEILEREGERKEDADMYEKEYKELNDVVNSAQMAVTVITKANAEKTLSFLNTHTQTANAQRTALYRLKKQLNKESVSSNQNLDELNQFVDSALDSVSDSESTMKKSSFLQNTSGNTASFSPATQRIQSVLSTMASESVAKLQQSQENENLSSLEYERYLTQANLEVKNLNNDLLQKKSYLSENKAERDQKKQERLETITERKECEKFVTDTKAALAEAIDAWKERTEIHSEEQSGIEKAVGILGQGVDHNEVRESNSFLQMGKASKRQAQKTYDLLKGEGEETLATVLKDLLDKRQITLDFDAPAAQNQAYDLMYNGGSPGDNMSISDSSNASGTAGNPQLEIIDNQWYVTDSNGDHTPFSLYLAQDSENVKLPKFHLTTRTVTYLNMLLNEKSRSKPQYNDIMSKLINAINEMIVVHEKTKSENTNDKKDCELQKTQRERWVQQQQANIDRMKAEMKSLKKSINENVSQIEKNENENKNSKNTVEKNHALYVENEKKRAEEVETLKGSISAIGNAVEVLKRSMSGGSSLAQAVQSLVTIQTNTEQDLLSLRDSKSSEETAWKTKKLEIEQNISTLQEENRSLQKEIDDHLNVELSVVVSELKKEEDKGLEDFEVCEKKIMNFSEDQKELDGKIVNLKEAKEHLKSWNS